MKVVAFNGSPRSNGNTAHALKTVLSKLESEGIDTELVQLGGKLLYGCKACLRCRETKDGKCAFGGDGMNDMIAKMIEADGILIGSPTYFSNLTPETKALIDRAGYVTRASGNLLKRKVGAAVAIARRAGANVTFASINYFFLINEMIVPSSSYWNMSLSQGIDDLANDKEGIKTFETLGKNMAWAMKKLYE